MRKMWRIPGGAGCVPARALVGAAVAVMLAAPAAAVGDEAAARKEFVRVVEKRLREQHIAFKYDADNFKIVLRPKGSKSDAYWNLRNSFDEWSAAAAADRPAILDRFLRLALSALGPVPTLADGSARLLPFIRDRAYFDAAPLLARQPLSELLRVGVAIDRDEQMTLITDEKLKSEAWTFERALAVARDNLRARSEEPLVQLSPGLWASRALDSYDSSRILLPELFTKLPLSGAPVVLVPCRDLLLVAGDRDATALMTMADEGERAVQSPRPITLLPLRWDGKVWRDFLPDVTPEVRHRYHRLSLQSQADYYAEQKRVLEPELAKRHEDVFVASYSVAENKKTGEVFSYAVWTRGVLTLLPRAEDVMFGDPEHGVQARVHWARVIDVMGPAMKKEPGWPDRWRIERFPTDEEMARLKK
jgi:uncharacterized protein YtpQ (UPF0354 family)